MKTPTLEEVKEYFKDAKEVKSLSFMNGIVDISLFDRYDFREYGIWFDKLNSPNQCKLWSPDKGYAEIITYKNNNIMKSDLSKVKVGDSIWTIRQGKVKIEEIGGGKYPIQTKDFSYTIDGKLYDEDQHPSAFLTNPFKGYRVDEEFIKEAYQSACSDWKAKLKDKFPDVFKSELEVNKWFKTHNDKGLVFLNSEHKYGKAIGFGFTGLGEWTNEWLGNPNTDNLTLATEQEVEEALINEAKKRGFEYEANVLSLDNVKDKIGGSFFIFKDGSFWNNGFNKNICLMRNGNWAKIIQQPIELTLEEIAEKFNVDVKLLKIKK